MKKEKRGKQAISKDDLVRDFRRLGVDAGMKLMVHSSLSALGWVIGGGPTVVQALIDCVGETGTIVMPSATPYCLHPSTWDKVDLPDDWIPKIVEALPIFDVDTTPTSMGTIPETFRNWPGTVRSDHPISSVCARGKLADEIVQNHKLEISEGPETPYEKVYELDFNILLLGVGFNRCTMLHFSESRSVNRRLTTSNYPVLRNNKREWIEVDDMGYDNGLHFPKIGNLYIASGRYRQGDVGQANVLWFPARELVDFGTKYFDEL